MGGVATCRALIEKQLHGNAIKSVGSKRVERDMKEEEYARGATKFETADKDRRIGKHTVPGWGTGF